MRTLCVVPEIHRAEKRSELWGSRNSPVAIEATATSDGESGAWEEEAMECLSGNEKGGIRCPTWQSRRLCAAGGGSLKPTRRHFHRPPSRLGWRQAKGTSVLSLSSRVLRRNSSSRCNSSPGSWTAQG